MTKKSLYPEKQIELNIPVMMFMIIIFAIIFFIIGYATMHYPTNMGWV